jgi:predicted anti-sigma-YlaC factor YlaD
MIGERCMREDELLDALERRFVGAELASHVASCASCHELHSVAGALLDDRAQAMLEAPVPSAGTMWWRLQLRRRQDAQLAARRSLLIGQAATVLIALSLLIAIFGSDLASGVRQAVGAVRMSTPMLVIAASWLLAAPIAGWVAIRTK